MTTEIKSTTNYDLFEPYEINRNIKEESKAFKNLVASMQKYGFLPSYPLHCVANGDGKVKVKAGHHRLRAAQKLGIAVKYVITDDDASVYELEGAGPHIWTNYDYFVSYCKKGFPSYLELEDFMTKTGISLTDAASMFHGNTAGSGSFISNGNFQEGLFKIKNREHPWKVGNVVLYLKSIGVNWAHQTNMVKALSRIVRLPEFDVERFKYKAKVHKVLLERQKNLQAYLQLIEYIYNYKSPKAQKVNLSFWA